MIYELRHWKNKITLSNAKKRQIEQVGRGLQEWNSDLNTLGNFIDTYILGPFIT